MDKCFNTHAQPGARTWPGVCLQFFAQDMILGRILDEDELMEPAARAYRQRCLREGYGHEIPSQYKSTITGNRLVLRNCNGVLAIYDIGNDGRLTWVEPTEARVRYYENNW